MYIDIVENCARNHEMEEEIVKKKLAQISYFVHKIASWERLHHQYFLIIGSFINNFQEKLNESIAEDLTPKMVLCLSLEGQEKLLWGIFVVLRKPTKKKTHSRQYSLRCCPVTQIHKKLLCVTRDLFLNTFKIKHPIAFWCPLTHNWTNFPKNFTTNWSFTPKENPWGDNRCQNPSQIDEKPGKIHQMGNLWKFLYKIVWRCI